MNEKLIQALRKYAENAQKNNEFDTMRDLEGAADALEAADAKLHEQDLRIADLVAHLNAEQVKVARLVTENRHLKADIADYHHMSELVNGKMAEIQRLRRINENLATRAQKAERKGE